MDYSGNPSPTAAEMLPAPVAADDPLPMPVMAPTAEMASPSSSDRRENTRIRADELDLDDLTRRLYERVQRNLRADLIIERERLGLIPDLR
jgi:hypothetical protein